ncbi:Possible subunit of benzoyl-CoA reductase/2-hydroxyglutaryl-CoA dehydratase [hydrothermal vent metagenome]|uniref:Possible subunit of benzoyl-CoA reductase/2-hydroxyglutaryl-CoA dehydratase n=1 Tax=hydrothermal vent metagenome TaxID=652676 RepID=A0A3B1CES3_9ZZZZ
MARIGITTTVPSEIIFAAGSVPVDLNNIFITDINRSAYFEQAEVDGFPRPLCGWIKGMYSACLDHKINEVIAVTQGDCSNTHVLMEIYRMRGVKTVAFNFPYGRDPAMMKRSIELLYEHFGVDERSAEKMRVRLNRIRAKLGQIDRMTWRDGVVTGFENHLLLVSSSDFDSDPDTFEAKLDRFITEAGQREPMEQAVRLGMIGIPPILDGLYPYIEEHGARVVYNEVQRQFTMPFGGDTLAEQYLKYTYPYDIGPRIDDINQQISTRCIDGIIHYVQSFCHRQMEDLIFRERIDVPILTIEGDSPRPVDARAKIRLESFIRMILARKGAMV